MLTAYDGQTITYDTIGNPLTDGTWTYTWKHGRQLASMTDGSTTWNYTYNADGLRTKRTNGTTTYNYVYNGSQLSQMTVGSNSLYFAYDASGIPMSVTYNGTNYYYVTNVQGDVVGILNASGALVVSYTYDAWGNSSEPTGSLASTLGVHNPLRYRSYVYDSETKLYYLQSRYYNPEVGRFINADAFAATGQGLLGNNMFAYCHNNPINYIDPTGELLYPGEIHNQVVKRIAYKYGFTEEQWIRYGSGKLGRADLISWDGQVWDVKRDKPRHIAAGEKQVINYTDNSSRWINNYDTPLSVGRTKIEPGFFYHQSGLINYKVTYRDAGNGVIAYDYRITEFDTSNKALQATATIAAICAALYDVAKNLLGLLTF